MTTPPAPATGWRAAFPPAQWLASYQGAWLPRDAVAGVTLAAYAIPVSLAYATLAGLPPQYGIYCYLAGGLALRAVRLVAPARRGPTSAISMLVGATVAGMAGGDPARWADIAALTALVVAGMSVLAWALRLSSLVDFISETILLGFKAGAALTIAMTQLPKLFGVKGGGEHFFERIAILAGQLPDTNVAVLLFGLAALALLLAGEKLLPGRPVALAVVALSIVALSVTSLAGLGFSIVGELPKGLPDFRAPELRLRDVDGVIPLAFACLLLAYVEGVSAARTLAQKNGYAIDPRQELLGLGAANLAAAFSQGYPVAGGLSQSSVNDKAGAKTPLALVFASLTIALCLIFLTGLLRNLPNVVLAAIVLVAVKGLINVGELRHLWRVSRFEFGVSMVALARRAGARDPQGRDARGGGVAAAAHPARGAPARRLPRAHPRFPRPFGHGTQPGQRAGPGRARLPRRGGVALLQRRARARRRLDEDPLEPGAGAAGGVRSVRNAERRPRRRADAREAARGAPVGRHRFPPGRGARRRAGHPARRRARGARRLFRPPDRGGRRRRRVRRCRQSRRGRAPAK